MPELHVDVLGFAEIGGVGEMIYHTVRFPEYDLDTENDVQVLKPVCPQGCEPIKKTDYSLTGKKLLVSLCNLFMKINDPECKGSYIKLIVDWCKENTHPYRIDYLYDLLLEPDYEIAQLRFLVEKEGIFEINEFIRELANVYHTFAFYFALDSVKRGNDQYARDLYYEGRFYDGFPFFEKYRVRSLESEGTEPGKGNSDIQKSYINRVLADYADLQMKLLSLFPEFQMKLKANPRTKRVVYAADVQSVFDICWYTLSRMVADDAPPMDYDSESEFAEGSILSCLGCGNFYIRKSSTQKYCDRPDCQAERNRRKARASYIRKKNNLKD